MPRVVGKSLAAARKSIARGKCRLGKVSRRYSAKGKKNRVIAQSPKAGKKLARNAKVNLIVSLGARR